MFNMSEFLRDNLINGYLDGSFSETQVNIFSFNYLSRGQLAQEHFDEIQEVLNPVEEIEE